MGTYSVKNYLHFEGRLYQPGEEVELSDEQAGGLAPGTVELQGSSEGAEQSVSDVSGEGTAPSPDSPPAQTPEAPTAPRPGTPSGFPQGQNQS